MLRLFGAKIGCGVVIKPRVNIKYPWNLTIGDHTWIGEGVWIDNLASVTIGSNCCLSQGAMLLCGNHNYKDKYFGLFVKPIVLGDETWIGAQSLVCPGSEMGTGAVLAVRSVLRGKAEAGWIYDGNPAVKIRQRKELV